MGALGVAGAMPPVKKWGQSLKLVAAVAAGRSSAGKEGSDCGVGKKPQLDAWNAKTPAVPSQTTVRRIVLAMPLAVRVRRVVDLRGFFFLVIGAEC